MEGFLQTIRNVINDIKVSLASGGVTHTQIEALKGYIDTLETLFGTSNTKLDTVIGHIDGIETLFGTSNTNLSTIIGHIDGIEGMIDNIESYLDTVEAKLQSLVDAGSLPTMTFATGTSTSGTVVSHSGSGKLYLAGVDFLNSVSTATWLEIDGNPFGLCGASAGGTVLAGGAGSLYFEKGFPFTTSIAIKNYGTPTGIKGSLAYTS